MLEFLAAAAVRHSQTPQLDRHRLDQPLRTLTRPTTAGPRKRLIVRVPRCLSSVMLVFRGTVRQFPRIRMTSTLSAQIMYLRCLLKRLPATSLAGEFLPSASTVPMQMGMWSPIINHSLQASILPPVPVGIIDLSE